MPYLIFTANGEEYDRRELRGSRPMVIGRAPDCDVTVHDIILSRHHCRIERDVDGHWVITDLQSKNGTQYLGHAVERHVLREADELRVGRSRLTFRSGAFVPSPSVRKSAVVRPSDPSEALAGTVTGMVVCEPGETQKYEGMPSPKPRPADPGSYARDDVYGMINEIMSSSWDSIQAEASQPIRRQRATPVPAVTKAHRGAIRPKPRVSFALQANREGATTTLDPAPQAPSMPLKPPVHPHRRRWIVAVSTLVATVLIVFVWMAMFLQASSRKSPTVAPPAPPQRNARQNPSTASRATAASDTLAGGDYYLWQITSN